MSWHILAECESSPSSLELVEASLEAISWDGERFAPSNGLTTLGRYCLPDSETEFSPDSRSGMTCRHSTGVPGEGELMSSQAGSLAKTSPQPGREPESMDPAPGCGSTWQGSFARFDRDSSSWRTPQCSLLEGLDVYSGTWPRWGMMRRGECWEREILVHGISEIAYGSLPTPLACDGTTAGGLDRTKNGRFWNLRDWYRVQMGTETGKHARQRKAAFWEWLMGWPENWTELKPQGTGRFQLWLQQHSAFSQKDS